MTIEKFNELYGEKGGIGKLTEMRDSLSTLVSISVHFGVSRERIRQWMIQLFGEAYDPRKKRRENKIEAIKELIKTHGVERTKQLYSGINKYYLKEALKNI